MIRKDLTQDSDRPHFYSQYWLDIAAGKPTTRATEAAPAIEDEDEDEAFDFAPVAPVKPKAEPKKPEPKKPEPARPTLSSLADLANIDLLMRNSAELGEDAVPDIESGDASDLEPSIVTDFAGADATDDAGDLSTEDLAEDEGYDDFDEEEEEGEWGGPRKPGKGAPKRPPRREPRRGF